MDNDKRCNIIRVAVIDQGVDLDHPDLAANLLPGFDATDGGNGGINGDCWGDDAHGTSCAGIIGAINNTIGTIGVAPNCRIIPIRVSYSQNNIQRWNDDWIVNAINHAWEDDNADVLSCSWGGGIPVAAVNNEISAALNQGRNNRGCIVVFSTGNDNTTVAWPANSNPDIIAVGAMSPCGQRKSPNSCDGETWYRPRHNDYLGGSNFGNELDLIAPGVLIPTTDIQSSAGNNTSSGTGGNYYQKFNGTSSATPHVAGVAALILSVNPDLTQDQVRDVIESTCTKVGSYNYSTVTGRTNGTWDDEVGYGCVNAYAAIKAIYPYVSGAYYIGAGSTFKVNNLEPGSTVSWDYTPNLYLSSASGDSAFFTPNGTGPGYITVTINSPICGSITLPKIGVAVDVDYSFHISRSDGHPVTINNYGELTFCPDTNYEIYLSPNGVHCYTSNHIWQVPEAWTINYNNGSTISINTNGDVYNVLVVDAIDCRGEDVNVSLSFEISTTCDLYSSYSLILTPNPSINETKLTIIPQSGKKENSIDQWDLEIYDSMQALKVKAQKIKGDTKTINTSSWKDGVYLVRVKIGDKLLSEKLVVKH